MSKKKKIWLTVLLGLLIGFSLYILVPNIRVYIYEINFFKDIEATKILYRLIIMFAILLISSIFAILLEAFLIIRIWKINYFVKMTYEEYKEKKKEKQRLKLIEKKEYLQKQLDEMKNNQ